MLKSKINASLKSKLFRSLLSVALIEKKVIEKKIQGELGEKGIEKFSKILRKKLTKIST
jgi:hypothetical protein